MLTMRRTVSMLATLLCMMMIALSSGTDTGVIAGAPSTSTPPVPMGGQQDDPAIKVTTTKATTTTTPKKTTTTAKKTTTTAKKTTTTAKKTTTTAKKTTTTAKKTTTTAKKTTTTATTTTAKKTTTTPKKTTTTPKKTTTKKHTTTAKPTTTPHFEIPSPAPGPQDLLCNVCNSFMDLHPDDSCRSIQDQTGENCTICGCTATGDVDPFLTSPEFYLIIVAACVLVVLALFVGICMCRRNMATTTTRGNPMDMEAKGHAGGLAHEGLLHGDYGITDTKPPDNNGGNNAPLLSSEYVNENIAEAHGEIARVRYNFTADSAYEEQISVKRNDRVLVLEKFDDGWWKVEHDGRVGIVPASYCTSLDPSRN